MKNFLFTVAIATILQSPTFGEDIECFAAGECTGSLYVDQWPAADAQECLEICREEDGCEFFTHYGGGDDLCLGLANCVELDDKTCIDCYSGNKTCPDLQCWVPGTCEGTTISVDVVSREEECLAGCKAANGCNWLTFDETDGGCVLLEDCLNLEENGCNTCWSSQVPCGKRQDFTKTLVIGGYSVQFGYLDNVEAVDLSAETPTCDSVSDYPFPDYISVGTILDGLPTVCGGFNGGSGFVTNECYQYLYEENRWVLMNQTMLLPRYQHKSSMVDSATWLISGGRNNIGGYPLDSTEVWQNGEFQPGPFMPHPLYSHCQVTLNSSYVAILGGYDDVGYPSKHFYLLDWNNKEWFSMPDVPVTLYDDPCGLIENSVNGFELVVLADHDDCYIFNFRDMAWRQGPDIPNVMLSYGSMPVQMEKTFYILGGRLYDGTSTDVIFKFDNENYVWNQEAARLDIARDKGVAISVPDESVNCN